MASGKIKWFDNRRGFGFIYQDSGPDVFVHHTSIVGSGYKTLNEGEKVVFDAIPSNKGFKAKNVRRSETNPSWWNHRLENPRPRSFFHRLRS
jgi:CspA family cold shock protein